MNRLMKKVISATLTVVLMSGLLPTTAMAEQVKEGTFTAVSMNVDGLPNKILGITINGDGPGSEGTKKISAKMASYGWDIIGVSEDFNYNTELMSSLTNYTDGTHRGGVSGLSNDTDGLNLIWKNTISVSGEKWTSWNTHYSTGIFGTGNGADGMIDKGYRYYKATVADGVNVDVYILHMDADSDAGDIAARESQLTQLADAIKASDNKNPIIVMGDTNCRYTREQLKSLFIDALDADNRFTVKDTWVEKVWNGTYPSYGADAMVAKDKGGTYDYPQAEIVDKIFCINNTDSDVKLTINSHTVATDFTDDNGNALADHWPVVVEFGYTLTTADSVCEHEYQVTQETEATCTVAGSKTFTCTKCGDTYDEAFPATGHTEVVDQAIPATCTEEGHTEGTHCSVCNSILKAQEIVPATGHTYENGVCTVCGEVDPNYEPATPIQGATFGEKVDTLSENGEYALIFSGTTGLFGLERNESGSIQYRGLQSGEIAEGSSAPETLIWTLTAMDGGYTISTQTDAGIKYLGRSNIFTGYGYKVSLQDAPFVWSLEQANDGLRFYTKTRSGSTFYLRYYSSRQGWIAALKGAGICAYKIYR